jgi:hypothetical protein
MVRGGTTDAIRAVADGGRLATITSDLPLGSAASRSQPYTSGPDATWAHCDSARLSR